MTQTETRELQRLPMVERVVVYTEKLQAGRMSYNDVRAIELLPDTVQSLAFIFGVTPAPVPEHLRADFEQARLRIAAIKTPAKESL